MRKKTFFNIRFIKNDLFLRIKPCHEWKEERWSRYIKADGVDDYQAGWRPGKGDGLIEQLRQISLSFLNLGLVSQVPTWGTSLGPCPSKLSSGAFSGTDGNPLKWIYASMAACKHVVNWF